MTQPNSKVRSLALLLLGLCFAACAAKTDETGGESNWVCADDSDCEASEHCVATRCQALVVADASAGTDQGDGDDSANTDGTSSDISSNSDDANTDVSASDDVTASDFTSTEPATSSNEDTSSVTDVGDSSADTEPLSDADAGASEVPAHCAYPVSARDSVLGGPVSSDLLWQPRVDLSCGFSLSEPMALSLTDADSGGRALIFSFDVNTDGVDDLFIRDQQGVGVSSSIELWVSELVDGVLRFRYEPCALPEAVAAARRFYLVDLNGDAAPDLLAGMENGVIALENTRQGFAERLNFEWADAPMEGSGASILAAEAADLSGDGVADLVVGFDRTPDGVLTIETGVLVFTAAADGNSLTEMQSYSSVWTSGVSSRTFWGGFAIHRRSGQAAKLLLQVQEEDRTFSVVEAGSGTSLNSSSLSGADVYKLWSTTLFGTMPLFATLGPTPDGAALDFFVFSGEEPFWGGGLEPQFEVDLDRELGGGALRERQFVLDVDGNATADFVELDRAAEAPAAAIHLGDMLVHFTAPTVLPLAGQPAVESSPFIAAGGQSLGLLFYDGYRPLQYPDVPAAPPALQQFRCAGAE